MLQKRYQSRCSVFSKIQPDTLKSNVVRYTTFLRDFLELADPRSVRTGVKLFNILSDNQVSHIIRHIDGINETVYRDNIPQFLKTSRGFITQLAFAKNDTVTISIRVEIPWAYQNDIIPIFRVHQIGFIPTSGGPCSRLVLPKTLEHRYGSFYRAKCQSIDCIDGSFAPFTPSCLRDGSNVSCAAHLSPCEQVSPFTMASGILLPTNYNVHGVYRGGDRVKLFGDRSMFISWDKISRVDVERRTPAQGNFTDPFTHLNSTQQWLAMQQSYSLRTCIMKI